MKFKTSTNQAEIASAVIIVLPPAIGLHVFATANLQFIVSPRNHLRQAQRLHTYLLQHSLYAPAHSNTHTRVHLHWLLVSLLFHAVSWRAALCLFENSRIIRAFV